MNFMKLSELISNNAQMYPDKNYAYFKDDVYTYRQAEEEVLKIAHVLRAHGVEQGDRVTILLNNSSDYLFTYFAVAKLGAIAVPMNAFLKEREVALNMNDCGSEYLITSNTFSKVVEPLLPLVPQVKKVFTFENTDLGSININKSDKASIEPINVNMALEDVVVILYTSGTTGKPKGVMLSHHNLIENARSYALCTNLVHKDITVLLLPMFHSFTFAACILGPLVEGSGVVILESVNEMFKENYNIMLKALHPTLLLGVPQVYSALTRIKTSPEQDIYFPYRLCISGGAPLPMETIERFRENFGVAIVEGYGLSEASPVVSINPEKGVQKPGTVGLPIPNVEVKVVDEYGNVAPVNVPGELWTKGPNVMKGYWNQPEETAKVLQNGWLHTGDVAIMDEDGYIAIVDRIKDLIIAKGINVYPREIEEFLYKYKGVSMAAVIGVPEKDGNEIIIAYIKPEENVALSEAAIKSYLKANFALYKVPKSVIFVDNIPLNPNGKVLKRELRELAMKNR